MKRNKRNTKRRPRYSCAGCFGPKYEHDPASAPTARAIGATENALYEPTDPLGSWTGVPRDKSDEPTQDADDL